MWTWFWFWVLIRRQLFCVIFLLLLFTTPVLVQTWSTKSHSIQKISTKQEHQADPEFLTLPGPRSSPNFPLKFQHFQPNGLGVFRLPGDSSFGDKSLLPRIQLPFPLPLMRTLRPDFRRRRRCGIDDNEKHEIWFDGNVRSRESETLEFKNFRSKRSTNNEIIPSTKPKKKWKWNRKFITYRVSEYTKQDISPEKIDKDLAQAFKLWEEHVDLKFIRNDSIDSEFNSDNFPASQVDIDIRFVTGEHGDDTPFTGDMAETLGHAFPPAADLGGDIHFNDNFTWSEGTTFLHTATHEIGHSLGMNHVMVRTAIMSPYQGDSSLPVVLDPEDIRQVQAIYGPKEQALPLPHQTEKPQKLGEPAQANLVSTTPRPRLSTTTTAVTRYWWYSTGRFKETTFPTTTTTTDTPSTEGLSNKRTETITYSRNSTTATTVGERESTDKQSSQTITSVSSTSTDSPIQTTPPPNLVETVLESTVSTQVSNGEGESEKSVTELWTKSNNGESILEVTTPALIQDIVKIPEVFQGENDLPTPPSKTVDSDNSAVADQKVFLTTAEDLKTTTTPKVASDTIKYDSDDRVYFCDSNELCSKKELEENLKEDTLALGSGNFELTFDEESDSQDSINSNGVTNQKTETPESESTIPTVPKSTTYSDLFLSEDPDLLNPTLADNITNNDNKSGKSESDTLTTNSSPRQKCWLSFFDIIVRSTFILLIVHFKPSEYFALVTFENGVG